MKTLYEKNSTKVVEDKDGFRAIMVDGVCQGWFNPTTFKTKSPYIEYIMTHLPIAKKDKTALVLGGGAGIIPTLLQRQGFIVDVVEQSEEMMWLAQNFFGFDNNGRIFWAEAWDKLESLGSYFYSVCDVFNGAVDQANENKIETLSFHTRNFGHWNHIGDPISPKKLHYEPVMTWTLPDRRTQQIIEFYNL